MKYYSKNKGIQQLVNLLYMEHLIPIFGSGFSGGMPSYNGVVPMGDECANLMKDLLRQFATASLSEEDINAMGFSETAMWLRRETQNGIIPEDEYIQFFRNFFTDVKLDQIRQNVLKLPWKNAYTINIDDGIERTNIFTPILPYKNIREDFSRKDRLYKLHGDANYEVNYRDTYNIVFDSRAYRSALEMPENRAIRNNILTAYKEFNIVFIGCSLLNEPDLEWFYNHVKDNKENTKIFYITRKEIKPRREAQLETYGVTDIIKIDDYESFYIDFVHAFNVKHNSAAVFPYINPVVSVHEDKEYRLIYGFNPFEERYNKFNRSDILIDRQIYIDINNAFQRNKIVVLAGRRFSGRTSLMAQICRTEKTRRIYYFPSSSEFDYSVVRNIIISAEPSLLLFDSNSMQPDVYLGLRDLRNTIEENSHNILVVEALEDTYFTETLDCEVVRLNPRFETAELEALNNNLDKYGLIHRSVRDTNLDYLIRLKEEQKIDFPQHFKFPFIPSDIEEKLLLILAAQDKVYSRDLHMMQIRDSEIRSILQHLDRLCEKVPTVKGESRAQSSYKLVHNSRALILYLLRNSFGARKDEIAIIVKSLVKDFYQSKDRMQKKVAISIMQFDTLNEVYGKNRGAGRLIERVYEELQEVLHSDSHYWLQRSKCIYRMYPDNVSKLLDAYKYCVKATDSDTITEKLRAQTALSLSLISGLLSTYGEDEDLSYAEQCIIKGYYAMTSPYYSSHNRDRLEKERIGYYQTYEDLCLKVCDDYIWNVKSENVECKNTALKIKQMLSDKD